ncbi:MAG TPA: hypothetical protein VMZ50_09040 [Phycisphaerae bacterium]|nr:hypothetical protein [Phycisphaerae bacterium]
MGVETSRAIDLADAWEESLGLDARPRDLEAMESDLGELFAVAADCLAGRLGAVGPCQNTLATLAHQIGRRDPRADRPLGMFLAEVKRLRIAAFLRRP